MRQHQHVPRGGLAASVLAGVLFLAGGGRGAELVAVDVAQFFIAPHVATVLQWRTRDRAAAAPQPYTLRDYWRREVGQGRTVVAPNQAAQVTLNLPPGYYEIAFPATSQEFGIAAVPAHAGPRDAFFAIDAAMSWLVDDRRHRDGLVRILRRSGVAMSRERLAWAAVSAEKDRMSWDTPRGYETLRRAYADQDVEVLEMCHDAPGWLGRVGKYPADLPATVAQWAEITRRWQSTWGAVEVWNEPDIFFGDNLPGDQYAALVKAVSLGLAAGGCARPVVGGVCAHYHEDFLNACHANGMLDFIDALSFHTYARAPEMEPLVEKYRAWLQRHGQGALPLWLTECGRPWKRGPGRPPLTEDANSALDIAMKVVEARACGIARHFPFVYPYYEENDNNFGMMGRAADPLRAMAGYAQLIRVLSHKRYLGDWRDPPASVQRARVFGDDHAAVLVVYTGKSDQAASVPWDIAAARIEGLDGRSLSAAEPGLIPVPDGLTYVWLDRAQLAHRVRADTKAMRLCAAGQQSPPRRGAASSIALRLEMDREATAPETKGYRVRPGLAADLPLKVRVFNLGPRLQRVQCELVSAQPRLAGEQRRDFALPAGASRDLDWRLDLRPSLRDGRAKVEIQAATADERGATRLALDLFVPPESAKK